MNMKYILIISLAVIVLSIGAWQVFKSDKPDSTGRQTEETVTAVSGEAILSDWCAEHRVPEFECTICNPALIDSFKARTYKGKSDWCAGHNLPESHCRLCNPEITFPQEALLNNETESFEVSTDEIKIELFYRKNSLVCATDGALIQFASAETVQRAGLSIQKAIANKMSQAIEAPAETKFDETHYTVVTISVPALVAKWAVSPGDAVEKGDVLAAINSPEIAELQASYLAALADYNIHKKELLRFDELKSKKMISESEYDKINAESKKSQAILTSSRGLLMAAGMSEKDIEEFVLSGQVSNQILLRAPDYGIVVERKAQLGELLDKGKAFALLADPNSMWIEANLSEEQIRHVKEGQVLTFTSDGRGLNRVGAKIIWVSRQLDTHTRTGTVRAKLLESPGKFQAGEFGRVQISTDAETGVALVSKDAVQWEGCCSVVFVKESDSRFRPRKVQFSEGTGPYYQITDGIKPGEEVVVDGAFLLKTELKKTSLGAGCCGIEPAG